MNARKITHNLVACLALAGCASTGTATPTATQPPQPASLSTAAIAMTETLAPTVTPRPTSVPPLPTETEPPMPTDTPIPTATVYPTPAIPLSSTGPWLLFRAGGYRFGYYLYYLWAINPDGTGLTQLTDECVNTYAVRPNSTVRGGIEIAYSTSLDGKCEQPVPGGTPPGLIKILSGSERTVKTIVYNLSQGARKLVWSPSGSKLAFTGAMDDPSLNAFVYDFATEQASRIAVTEDDDYLIGWSPDEQYVIHETLQVTFMGAYVMTGAWSSRSDAGGVTQIVGLLENQWAGHVKPLGWLSPTEIIITLNAWTGEETVSNRDIRMVNIETGAYQVLIREPFLDVAYSPEHNMFLMTKESTPAPNRLLVFYQNGERREVAGYTIKEVRWLSAYDAFLGQTPDGRVFLISSDGTVTEIPTPKWETYDSRFINAHSVIVSPDHQWWAQYHSRWTTASSASELWVGPAKAQPSVRLSTSLGTGSKDGLVNSVIWSPDSQHLLWLSGRRLFVANSPNFEATMVAELPEYRYLESVVWVQ